MDDENRFHILLREASLALREAIQRKHASRPQDRNAKLTWARTSFQRYWEAKQCANNILNQPTIVKINRPCWLGRMLAVQRCLPLALYLMEEHVTALQVIADTEHLMHRLIF